MLLISTICNNIYVLFTLWYKIVAYYYLEYYLFSTCGDFCFFAPLFFEIPALSSCAGSTRAWSAVSDRCGCPAPPVGAAGVVPQRV